MTVRLNPRSPADTSAIGLRIRVYRYQYKERDPHAPPREIGPGIPEPPVYPVTCHFVESPQSIFDENLTKIMVRERGGPSNNHVQWVLTEDLEPCVNFEGWSWVSGVVTTASGTNKVGDTLWTRSDQPLIPGRTSCPVMNLTQLKSAEVEIENVRWRPDRYERSDACVPPARYDQDGHRIPRSPLTFAGPEYVFQGIESRTCVMCVRRENGVSEGVLGVVTKEDLLMYYRCFRAPGR